MFSPVNIYIYPHVKKRKRKKKNGELVSSCKAVFRHDMTKKGKIEEEKNKDRTVFLR